MSSTTSLGPRVRLRDLDLAELPAHPQLQSFQTRTAPADPRVYAEEVLAEGKAFLTEYLPRNFVSKSTSKTSPPSTAPVELLVKDVPASEVPGPVTPQKGESWFARKSVHDNQAASGTADWAEFERFLLDEHSLNEKRYTPGVYAAHQVLAWDARLLEELPGWEKVEMEIYEMCHLMPPPLNHRTFAVLIVKGRSASPPQSFTTVQIPVDVSRVPQALFSNARNRIEGRTADERKETTVGAYTSIEHAELVDEGRRVKWQMATASDAKGVLPMWAQKMGVPGAIVKDVGLFIDYAAKQRG